MGVLKSGLHNVLGSGPLELVHRHKHCASLRALRLANDPSLLEKVHETPSASKTYPQLALEHRGAPELAPYDQLHRSVQKFVVVRVFAYPARGTFGADHPIDVGRAGLASPMTD